MLKIFKPNDRDFASSNGDAILHPLKAVVRNELNGEYSLDVTCPLSEAEFFEGNNIIAVDLPVGIQGFRITHPVKTGRSVSAKCRHVAYDAENYLILDSHSTNETAQAALTRFNSAATPESPFSVYSDVAATASYHCERQTLQHAIQTVLDTWGGNLFRDNFRISVLSSIAHDYGENVQYKKGLKEITVDEDWSDVVTKLLPQGADGILLNAADASRDVFLTSSIQYAIPFCKTVQFDQSNIDRESYADDAAYTAALVADLQEKAEAYLREHEKPAVNYTLRANLERVTDLGDVIHVMDKRLGVDFTTQVIAYDYDCIAKRFTEIQFGTPKRRLSKLLSTVDSYVRNGILISAATTSGEIVSSTSYNAGDVQAFSGAQVIGRAVSQASFAFDLAMPKSMSKVTPTITALTLSVYAADGSPVLEAENVLASATVTARKKAANTLEVTIAKSGLALTANSSLTVIADTATIQFN